MAASKLFLLLALLPMAMISETFASPVNGGNRRSELVISGSILTGRPIMQDQYGPLSEGRHLTLTCQLSAKGVESAKLSWWFGDQQLESVQTQTADYFFSALDFEQLSVTQSNKVYVCKEELTGETNEVQLDVIPRLDIFDLKSKSFISSEMYEVEPGKKLQLSCTVTGVNPSDVSWLEDGVRTSGQQLTRDTYALANLLTIEPVTAAHAGRRFECRSAGRPNSVFVTLHVSGSMEAVEPETKELNLLITLIIVATVALFTLTILLGIYLYKINSESTVAKQTNGLKKSSGKLADLKNTAALSTKTFFSKCKPGLQCESTYIYLPLDSSSINSAELESVSVQSSRPGSVVLVSAEPTEPEKAYLQILQTNANLATGEHQGTSVQIE